MVRAQEAQLIQLICAGRYRLSYAALDAKSIARPVVLSNIGGAAEMLEHNKSGYLFEVGIIDMLTDLLVKLYDSKPMRDRVGFAAGNA